MADCRPPSPSLTPCTLLPPVKDTGNCPMLQIMKTMEMPQIQRPRSAAQVTQVP